MKNPIVSLRAPRAPLPSVLSLLLVAGCGDDGTSGPADTGPMADGANAADGSADGATDTGSSVDCTGFSLTIPEPRGELEGVYDAANDRVVMFGGNDAVSMGCDFGTPHHVAEMWAFHVQCRKWAPIEASGGPSALARAVVVHDTQRNRLLLFGGRQRNTNGSYANLNDTWAFDLATDTWSRVGARGTPPSGRSMAAGAYDAEQDRLLVIAGNVSTDGANYAPVGDFFALDLATNMWSEITSPGGPSPRVGAAATLVGDELIVYGGTDAVFGGNIFRDAFAYHLTEGTWRTVHDGATGAPNGRFGGTLFADDAGGRAILAMGHDETNMGNSNDVWALDVAGGTWTPLRAGDTLNGSFRDCMPPVDFTLPEDGSPERRFLFASAQSESAGFVLFGKSDCGNLNDAWSLDLADGTWTLLSAPTAGEQCNRVNDPSMCTGLCM